MRLYAHYMTEIETYTEQLTECLRDVIDIQASRYFDLPRMTLNDEYQVLHHAYPVMKVTKLLGSDAASKALSSFNDWYVFEESLSRRFVHKHPGILVVPKRSDFEQVQHLCQQINLSKDNFKKDIQKQGKDADEKWRTVHNKYNYLITLSLYRHINCYDNEYDSAYFNWVTRPRTKRVAMSEMIERLQQSMADIPKGKDPQQWKTLLNDEIHDIEKAGKDELIMRRQVNFRPEVNLRVDGAMKSYSAGLPIILPSLPEKVSDLETLDVSMRATSKRANAYQLVVPRLNLYAKIDG